MNKYVLNFSCFKNFNACNLSFTEIKNKIIFYIDLTNKTIPF